MLHGVVWGGVVGGHEAYLSAYAEGPLPAAPAADARPGPEAAGSARAAPQQAAARQQHLAMARGTARAVAHSTV